MTEQSLSERSIFEAAVEKRSPEERAAYLDQVCGSNDELRKGVEALLAAHDRLGSVNRGVTVDEPRPGEAPGTVIGPYKLLEPIGEGGMGTVWMAQQTEPVKRVVAVKLIKAGMDSKEVIARFEAERQALALMDHANIARVLDAGTTSSGLPYFVMDLVKGVPITRYCDEHRLTPRQRLELFIPVCQAMQHAHQKGIIHRDLKPSNVLVALYDGRPVPKVIDFGVAKAAGPALTEKTLVTGFGALVGTLEYMSPEQAEINQLDIDTRSDIYSLGILLYELLTGSPPFTKQGLEKAGMLEMLRVIREQEPSKPSTKLSKLSNHHTPRDRPGLVSRGQTATLASIAANRGTEPAKLRKLVRGELDWIVMKCLEKDRSRRYETANGLGRDIERYLHDEQVVACPPSAGYRLRKFARRNRVALTTAAVVVLALVVGTAVSIWQAVRATRAEEQARQQRDAATRAANQEKLANTLLAGLLRAAAPEETNPHKTVTAEELFHQAVQKFIRHPQFKADPEVEASLRLTIGNTYYKLGTFPEAESYLRRAVELRADALGSEHPDTLAAEEALADLLCYGLRRHAEAELLSRRIWEARREILGPEDPDTLESLDTYASALGDQNRLSEAEALSRQCWEARTRVLGKENERTLISQNNLSVVLMHQGRLREAERLLRDCLEIRRRVGSRFDPQAHSDPQVETFAVMNNLAHSLYLLGQFDEAEKVLQEGLPVVIDSHGEKHWASLHLRHMLARVLLDKGRPDLAEPHARKALQLRREVLGPGHEGIGRSLLVLGRLLVETDRDKEAEPLLREAERLFRERYPAKQDLRGEAECRLGACLLAQKHYQEAEPLLLAGWAKIEKAPEMPSRQKEQILASLAKLYETWGKKGQAAAWSQKLQAHKERESQIRSQEPEKK
jgi:serine/threonine protein kinase/tetratricopeptide (TPR) repeat protein